MRKFVYKKRLNNNNEYDILVYTTNDGIHYNESGQTTETNTDYINYINEGYNVEELDPIIPDIIQLKIHKKQELEKRYGNIICNSEVDGKKLDYRVQINAIDGVYGQGFLNEFRNIRDTYRNEYYSKIEILNSFTFENKTTQEKFEIINQINELY